MARRKGGKKRMGKGGHIEGPYSAFMAKGRGKKKRGAKRRK